MSEDDRLWEEAPTVIFRPSYSATTLNCAGSLLPSMNAPDTAGYDAAVGTVFHSLIAEWQLIGERPDYLLGRKQVILRNFDDPDGFEVEIDDDMFVYAEECLDRYAGISGERYVEEQVDISSLTPIGDQGGTCDLAICSVGVLDVIDWKYGRGVKVYAENNTQLLCYAWGVFVKFDDTYHFELFRLHVSQPRLGHFDVWEVSRADLLLSADWIRERWIVAWSGRGDRSPSPKACQWCKIRTDCAALRAVFEAIADESFEPLDEIAVSIETQQELASYDPEPVVLTPAVQLPTERLAWIYQYRGMMEGWFKDIAAELVERGSQGDDLGGLFKVVQGRSGNRRWREDATAVKALTRLGVAEDDLWKHELLSPVEAEKQLRAVGVRAATAKRYLSLFTQRAPGDLTLVSTVDKRRSWGEIVDDTFE